MLLPIILPKLIALLSWMAAIRLTISSGVEVPKATIVKPMTISETAKRFARAEAPSTSRSAPLMSRKKPPSKKMKAQNSDN